MTLNIKYSNKEQISDQIFSLNSADSIVWHNMA